MSYDPQPPVPPGQGPGPGQGWSSASPGGQGYERYAMPPMPMYQQQWPPQQQWQPIAQPGMGMQPMVAPKSPGLCLLVSFFVPGVGSMVAGNTGTGVLILVLYIVSCVLSIILIGIPFAIGFWIWGMVDAYQSAQKWNAAHGIIS